MEARRKTHTYKVDVTWTGNNGQGTADYKSYERAHEIIAAGKHVIEGSSDTVFRGDKSRYNPEELLVAALSACHLLSYLHLCAVAGVIVTEYVDKADGVMVEADSGGGHFTEVTLKPAVTITKDSDAALAKELHGRAHHLCFIANSVNFPVRTEPTIIIEEATVKPHASSQA
jgi:organic hydroperoxide reductase OsmC/OhrA